MRKRVFNWQGQGFVYLGLEGKAGEPLEQQSQALFARAGHEVRSFRLSLDQNVVRSRVFRRTREARNPVSDTRAKTLNGLVARAPPRVDAPLAFAPCA